MRKDVGRRHDAHVRASGVCVEHGALLDATGGHNPRAALDAHVAEVDRLLALQARSIEDRRAATEQRRLSRRRLRDLATLIVRVGRLVNVEGAVMATMELPGPASDGTLVAYARVLIERVSPYADAFVAAGMTAGTLANLAAVIQRLEAARDAQAASRQRFTAASEVIRDTLNKADKTVGVLEAIVLNTPAGRPEVLTKLRMAKRVGRRAGAAVPSHAGPERIPDAKRAFGTAWSLVDGAASAARRMLHRRAERGVALSLVNPPRLELQLIDLPAEKWLPPPEVRFEDAGTQEPRQGHPGEERRSIAPGRPVVTFEGVAEARSA